MNGIERKKHWENIHRTKDVTEVSSYQPTPLTSLELIEKTGKGKNARIIDIGGGDSFLVDHLLDKGYTDITVLDISEEALNKAKKRLGEKASRVKWIVADVAAFSPTEKYDVWHDRAAFHFFTNEEDINKYVLTSKTNLNENGVLIIGTFSEQGPTKCSAIQIKQYSEESLTKTFSEGFEKLECFKVDHPTPFNTIQNFLFCTFIKE
ncbi:MAG: bifunctional 3-demethylubiquinone-9 3-methyltransferase/2-octaprenyl-6-hydroxy phenol methylase [Bacteroidetes bacterium]|jgi:ubiquinone/menaquinone biosynthesis C-methylase UbiE|nr:bifunctional 3-demethylubiquinone-9 3-methyltransferase/2-octaprenyl-6-hydroxy phenol methylase [Bacteroidota bacterium]